MRPERASDSDPERSAAPPLAPSPAGASLATVIIPIYNDADRLARCLAALEAQTYPRSRFEIIVVDNGSTDHLPAVAAQFPQVRFLSEPTPGSYAARNTGVAAATGDVIAFTDADCLPAPDWLANGVEALARADGCGLLAGMINVTAESADRPTISELYDSIFDFDQARFIARSRFGCTANVITPANVLRQVGGFDGRMRSVGDRDLGNRIAAAGYQVLFAPEVVVSHPGRRTIRDVLRKRLRVAGGHHQRAQKRSWPLLRLLHALTRQLLWNPFSGIGRIWRRGRHLSLRTKVRIFGLYIFLCYAEALERIRLQLGGEPSR
jgi:glycosyltransferase involved in cell wall biosynthesis